MDSDNDDSTQPYSTTSYFHSEILAHEEESKETQSHTQSVSTIQPVEEPINDSMDFEKLKETFTVYILSFRIFSSSK